ncbi:hypothetical protein PFISCL1PPCAC_20787, partial [Pristionchus fissidentatus]
QVMIWSGKEGRFEKKTNIVVRSMGMTGVRSAVAACTVKGVEEENNNEGLSAPVIDLLCVGTTTGAIGWMHRVHVSRRFITRIETTLAIAALISGSSIILYYARSTYQRKRRQISVRLFILTARAVTVQQLRVTCSRDTNNHI